MSRYGNYTGSVNMQKAIIELEKDILDISKVSGLKHNEIYSKIESLKSSYKDIKGFYAYSGRFPNNDEDYFIYNHGLDFLIKLKRVLLSEKLILNTDKQ